MEVMPGYKPTEVGVIPKDWGVCPVRQKGEVITGKALAAKAPGLQRPYLRTKNVFDGRIDIDDVLTMPMTEEQFKQFRLRNGDVLLNEGQSIELVGRCAIYQGEYPEPCAIQNALLRFRAYAGTSGQFASYLFRHCQHAGIFARIALKTTSVAHLGGSRFEKLRLPWPTETEQHAIASALSDVDGLLGALDRLIAKKRDLKQAAMQQLLTGQTRLPGFKGKWKTKRLGDLGKCFRGVSYKPMDLSSTDTKTTVRLLRSNNVQKSVIVFSGMQFVDSGRVSDAQYLKEQDILICMANGSRSLVGKAAQFHPFDEYDYTFGAFMGAFRPDRDTVDASFAFRLFHTQRYRAHIDILLAGSSINNLTPGSVEELEISIPIDSDEQAAIAKSSATWTLNSQRSKPGGTRRGRSSRG